MATSDWVIVTITFFLLKNYQGFIQQYPEKVPCQNWEKMIDLTLKLGKINNIEHNNWSKLYPLNQVILDCFMPSTSV